MIARPARSGFDLLHGAASGALGGGLGLLVMGAACAVTDREPIVAANAVGAWAVRWLQVADTSALDNFYPDATLVGIATALGAGAVFGSTSAAWLARLPEESPLAWGLLLALASWVLTRFMLAPALDPVLVRDGVFAGGWVLGLASIAYGLVVGGWLAAARQAGWVPETGSPASKWLSDHPPQLSHSGRGRNGSAI